MSEYVTALFQVLVGAIVGFFASELLRRLANREARREAAAALRFELESNLLWLEDIFETRNYLRDEAWVVMKNKGYISYLSRPIPKKVIIVYNELHKLNEQIRVLKEGEDQVKVKFDADKAQAARGELRMSITSLIADLDSKHPGIAKNFENR